MKNLARFAVGGSLFFLVCIMRVYFVSNLVSVGNCEIFLGKGAQGV
jgi:hypothetical protein